VGSIKKILVTGGCGFIGSNLVEYLNDSNFKVESLDNLLRSGSRLNEVRLAEKNIKNHRINISNKIKINTLAKYDLIIHCCADSSVNTPKHKVNETINTNFDGTNNIVEKCIKDKCYLIFFSSSRVYSIDHINKLVGKKILSKKINLSKKYLINEKFSTKSPITFYGFTKLASEILIKEYSNYHGLKYIINRPGVISGPWQFGKVEQGFVSLWIWRFFNKKYISYKGYGGNGYQVRDILHIDDLKELIFKQIKKIDKIYNKTFNIGGGLKNSIDLYELTKIVSNFFLYKVIIKKYIPTSLYDIPIYITDNNYVSKVYKWKPKKNIFNIIKDIFNWQKKYKLKLKKFI
jgi:CDP-paratose 2-epimerase